MAILLVVRFQVAATPCNRLSLVMVSLVNSRYETYCSALKLIVTIVLREYDVQGGDPTLHWDASLAVWFQSYRRYTCSFEKQEMSIWLCGCLRPGDSISTHRVITRVAFERGLTSNYEHLFCCHIVGCYSWFSFTSLGLSGWLYRLLRSSSLDASCVMSS